MSRSDAQHPPNPNTKLTGNLKLTKAGGDIDHETFFRQDLFGNQIWRREQTGRGWKESTDVVFDVTVAGTELGQHQLTVDHALYRIAGQSNVPTWLHWGSLMSTLLEVDYTGAWIIIERRANGTHRLEISWNTPPFDI